eukprot:2942112-Prymnesium_polylepis.3
MSPLALLRRRLTKGACFCARSVHPGARTSRLAAAPDPHRPAYPGHPPLRKSETPRSPITCWKQEPQNSPGAITGPHWGTGQRLTPRHQNRNHATGPRRRHGTTAPPWSTVDRGH